VGFRVQGLGFGVLGFRVQVAPYAPDVLGALEPYTLTPLHPYTLIP